MIATYAEPLTIADNERRAVNLAIVLTKCPIDDALEGLLDGLRAGLNQHIINRAGWLLLRWHYLAERGY